MNLLRRLFANFFTKNQGDFSYTEVQKEVQCVLDELKKAYQEIHSLKERNENLLSEIRNLKNRI